MDEAQQYIDVAPVLNATLDTGLFAIIQTICARALLHSKQHPGVRQYIITLRNILQATSRERFECDSIEVLALSHILHESKERPDVVVDILDAMPKKLSPEQRFAAEEIRHVNASFGRLLARCASNISKGAGKKTRGAPPSPLDYITAAEIHAWSDRYVPWFRTARRKKFGAINEAQAVVDIVFHEYSLASVDSRAGRPTGFTFEVLARNLDTYARLIERQASR